MCMRHRLSWEWCGSCGTLHRAVSHTGTVKKWLQILKAMAGRTRVYGVVYHGAVENRGPPLTRQGSSTDTLHSPVRPQYSSQTSPPRQIVNENSISLQPVARVDAKDHTGQRIARARIDSVRDVQQSRCREPNVRRLQGGDPCQLRGHSGGGTQGGGIVWEGSLVGPDVSTCLVKAARPSPGTGRLTQRKRW
jgi:hypothetical protein